MAVENKIGELNFAIKEALPAMREQASENPNAQVLIRAVTFSDSAQWHIATSTLLHDLQWSDISATPGALTHMGEALSLVAEQLRMPPMPERALPPVLVLVSDGQPTDDFSAGLTALLDQPWGKKAIRLAIAVGKDADTEVLARFIGNPEMEPLRASNAPTLIKYMRYATTVALRAASDPAAGIAGRSKPNKDTPIPGPPPADSDTPDVW